MLRVLHRSIGSLLGANPLVDIRIVSAGDIVEYQAFQRSVLRDFQTQRLSFVRRSSRLQRCTDERSNPSTLYRLKGGFATVVIGNPMLSIQYSVYPGFCADTKNTGEHQSVNQCHASSRVSELVTFNTIKVIKLR
jgi:hypothetical protein